MTLHQHHFEGPRPGESYFVIDTNPPALPYSCECGAFTHDPEVGTPCEVCAPTDYALRGPTITLRGGPYDGKQITRPVNRSVNLRADSLAKRVQKFVTYEQTSDPDVWKFRSNSWTVPFVDRDEHPLEGKPAPSSMTGGVQSEKGRQRP